MEQCQIDGIDELKIFHDVHNETTMKSIKNITIKKNTNESDHRTPKRKSDISNSNTLKKKKKYESALAAIFPENDQSYSQYAQDYAEGYMKKMRERLDAESFDVAIKLLASFGDADDSNINLLYQQITEVLTDKNEDLIYEFLGFLLPGQALSIGKFTDYLELTRIKEFIRKLQVCMKKQPTQVRKILDNLFHLSKSENITPLEVHTSMLPLLKSNPILVDCFFQLIPTEHPPESFFSDDNWEDLDIDQSINYGIDYEEIIPSDSEDPILLNICHCVCHKFGDNIHCRSCGLKFFKGRIYSDTPEGLKLAKINFEGADPVVVQSKLDKTKENITVKKKNRKSLVKNSSPGSAEDIKGSTGTESEEDLIDIKPKKRQKSKVVQSLKLKFKKEESPKCKNDQDVNDTGKSIVHVTNEELNSSEMVFFCIPKVESSIKSLPKRKSKNDVNESIIQNECEVINRIDNFDNSNSTVFNNVSEINNDCTLIINNDNLPNEITTDINFTPLINTIDSEPKVDCTSEQHETQNQIKIELNSQILKDDFSEKHNSTRQTSSDKSCKQLFKVGYVEDSETSNIGNIEQSDNINLTKNSTAVCLSSSSAITDIHTSLLDKNKITKSEIFQNLPECYVNVQKQVNEPGNQSINKWVIDKDKIKSEIIENLPECYAHIQKQGNDVSEKQSDNKWTFGEDDIKSEVIKNLPGCHSGIQKQDIKPENQSTNKWIIDKDKIKNEIIENLPKCYVHIQKQGNDVSEKPSDNKWTFGEDNIKSEVIENLPGCHSDLQKQDIKPENQSTSKWIIDKDKIKSEVIENLPECYSDVQKQDNNESEKQLTNKWTIDEDKIILQTCKRVEDIEVLLETINRRIPQRSVSEIQERFTTLMTLLEQMIDVKQN